MATVAHPRYNAVLDAGAYDGTDYTLPAFQAGYDVFTFEMAPDNQVRVVRTLEAAGLREGADYTIVRPVPGERPAPPPRAARRPHVYLFFAGVSSENAGVRVRDNTVVSAPPMLEIDGACHDAGDSLCVPVVRIDDVVPEWARLWVFKLDVQGHEPQALAGALMLLASRRVRTLAMEWWPSGMQQQGTPDGGIAALEALYALGARCFDLGSNDYNPALGMGIERASSIAGYTAALLAVPHARPSPSSC